MNIEQLKSKAKQALLDGKYPKALEFFVQLHEADPKDLRNYVKVAELREKTGDTAGAVKDYIKIANAYAEQGFVVQAIAINKIILRLDETKTEVKDKLKELSDERGDDWAVLTLSKKDGVTAGQAGAGQGGSISGERIPLLSGLSGEELESFMDSLELREVAAGEHIYKQGESGDHLYLIGMGSVELKMQTGKGDSKTYIKLHEGDFFGEQAFMARSKYYEDAVAAAATNVLMIDRDTFDNWVKKYPSIQSTVEDFYRKRVLVRVLALTPVFEGVPPEARQALADKFNLKSFKAGDEVVREGEAGDVFYLIRSGIVRISTKGMDGKMNEIELGKMREGSFFGEVSLLTDKPRTATVMAYSDLELMELTRDDFKTIVAEYPSVLKIVSAYQKKRVQDTIKTLMQTKSQ